MKWGVLSLGSSDTVCEVQQFSKHHSQFYTATSGLKYQTLQFLQSPQGDFGLHVNIPLTQWWNWHLQSLVQKCIRSLQLISPLMTSVQGFLSAFLFKQLSHLDTIKAQNEGHGRFNWWVDANRRSQQLSTRAHTPVIQATKLQSGPFSGDGAFSSMFNGIFWKTAEKQDGKRHNVNVEDSKCRSWKSTQSYTKLATPIL